MPVNSRREVRVQLLLSEIVSTTTQSFTVNLCRHLASVTHAFKGLNASERQMRYLVEFIEGKQAPLLRLDRKMGATRNCESIYIGRRVIWRQVARTFEIEIDARLDPGCVVATTPRYQNFRRGWITAGNLRWENSTGDGWRNSSNRSQPFIPSVYVRIRTWRQSLANVNSRGNSVARWRWIIHPFFEHAFVS